MIKIYGHENQLCPRCYTPLNKITISGRSSTFCPHCQK
ncbi:MAG: zinc finger domain-containing protein [Terrisporobacter sp.]